MKLKILEIALALALVFSILFSALAQNDQEQLAEKLVRLHVVANSDSEADQELKLLVRDRVLETAGKLVGSETSIAAAEEILLENLPAIEAAASAAVTEAGFDYSVSAKLMPAEFPEKTYDSFALPAGRYTALTISIGEAAGKNWWCVVFPPLCVTAASVEETAGFSGLSEEELGFITGNDEYVLKFKSLEVLAGIRELFS